jgi:hypothetical protein
MCQAFPDVLKVPIPAPPGFVAVPMPNLGQCATAMKVSLKVKVLNMPAMTKNSEIPKTNGGEAGTQKGMISPMQLEKVCYRMGSLKVKIEGAPAVMVMKPTGQNGVSANAPVGMQVAPSQAKVLISG